MYTTTSIFSWLSPAGYHIWLTFLIHPKVTSCRLSLSSAGSSQLIWEWLSSACPVLVEPCLAEPSRAEPSCGNTNLVQDFDKKSVGRRLNPWRGKVCHQPRDFV